MAAEETPQPASIRRNTILALGAELTSGILTAVLVLYLARKLGPEGYGLFGLAMSVGYLVLLPADLGLSQSAARFLAERRSDPSAMTQVLGDALTLKLIASTVFGVLMFALASPIADLYNLPALAWPLRAMAVAVFFQSVFQLFRSSFEAIGQMGTDWKMVGGESLTEVSATILIVALGGGAAGAVWGRAIGYAFGALLGFALAVRILGPKVAKIGSTDRAFFRRLARYGVALMIVDAVYSVFLQVDVLLVGAILGATAAGIFAAPLRLTIFLSYPGAAITAGVAPRLARGEGNKPDVEALEIGLRTLIALEALTLAPLIVWAGPIVHLLFGNGFGASEGVLRALAPFIFLTAPTRLLTVSVNYLGEARRRVFYAASALALNIVLDIVLINKIGVVGAAVGNDVAFALYAFGHLHICRQLTDLPLRPLAVSLLRSLVAAAAMGGLLLAIGTGNIAFPVLVAGLLAGTLLFGAVLLVLREPLVDELSGSLPPFAARLLRRRPTDGG